MVSGRNFERGSSDRTNENANLVLTLISITRCPEYGAQPGGTLQEAEDAQDVCLWRWNEAKSDLPSLRQCRNCQFVQLKPGEVVDQTSHHADRRTIPAEYYCRRFPPRRSLDATFYLIRVEPMGWCGEFAPFGPVTSHFA